MGSSFFHLSVIAPFTARFFKQFFTYPSLEWTRMVRSLMG